MSSTGDLLDGRYRLGPLLGRGGMSDVFRATDERDGDVVAIKIVRSADPEFAHRLAQEARALGRFEHPGLVRLLESGVTADMAYLVMEYVDGESLAETLRRGPLGAAATAKLGAALAGGLAYVHEQGVVHRDVKPANILIDSAGHARLADFGIARLVDTTTMTVVGTTLGTASYMAPEQLEDHQVGPGADVWSLGIVLLECLTGERVYTGTPSEVIARRLAGPVPLPATLPVPWKTLLGGMLDHRPDQRLHAAEVSALLATSVFSAPWDPAGSLNSDLDLTEPYDLTALSESRGDETTISVDRTVVIPPQLVANVRAPKRLLKWQLGVGVAILLAALISGIVYGFSTNSTAQSPSTTVTTTTSGPTTTTTALAPTSTSLAALTSDLASGVVAGSISPGADQPIANQAQQAVTDAAAGHLSQATIDLQQAATSVANGVGAGSISQVEGQQLLGDLNALAASLGLSPVATASSTTLPTKGHGHGNGNG
jgi:serine/threonine protein kinase